MIFAFSVILPLGARRHLGRPDDPSCPQNCPSTVQGTNTQTEETRRTFFSFVLKKYLKLVNILDFEPVNLTFIMYNFAKQVDHYTADDVYHVLTILEIEMKTRLVGKRFTAKNISDVVRKLHDASRLTKK